jgi:hypothetical protein
MSVPKHLLRHPTRAAIDSLANRFGLPNSPEMQDWEWEVADSNRISEFLAAYESGELTEDEKFVLMEIILQSSEDSDESFLKSTTWKKILALIEQNIKIHVSSVWYWANLEEDNLEDSWRITSFMRQTLEKHKEQFAQQDAPPDARNDGARR